MNTSNINELKSPMFLAFSGSLYALDTENRTMNKMDKVLLSQSYNLVRRKLRPEGGTTTLGS